MHTQIIETPFRASFFWRTQNPKHRRGHFLHFPLPEGPPALPAAIAANLARWDAKQAWMGLAKTERKTWRHRLRARQNFPCPRLIAYPGQMEKTDNSYQMKRPRQPPLRTSFSIKTRFSFPYRCKSLFPERAISHKGGVGPMLPYLARSIREGQWAAAKAFNNYMVLAAVIGTRAGLGVSDVPKVCTVSVELKTPGLT